MDNKKENKENFCSACVAIPIAMAGTGLSMYGNTQTSKDYRRQKDILFWSGIIISIIFLIITIYYVNTCHSCRIR